MQGAHTETEKRDARGTERRERDVGGRRHEMCGRRRGKGGEDGASVVVGTQNEEQRLLCRKQQRTLQRPFAALAPRPQRAAVCLCRESVYACVLECVDASMCIRLSLNVKEL